MAALRRFRFSLRTLLALVTLAGCSTALGDQLYWLYRRHEILRHWDVEVPDSAQEAPRAPGMLWLLGEPGRAIVRIIGPTDEMRAEVKRLYPEAEIDEMWLCGGVIDDGTDEVGQQTDPGGQP